MNRRRKQSIWLRRNLPLLIAVAALVLLVLIIVLVARGCSKSSDTVIKAKAFSTGTTIDLPLSAELNESDFVSYGGYQFTTKKKLSALNKLIVKNNDGITAATYTNSYGECGVYTKPNESGGTDSWCLYVKDPKNTNEKWYFFMGEHREIALDSGTLDMLLPLHLITGCGAASFLAALIVGIVSIVRLAMGRVVTGLTGAVILLLFLSGLIMVGLGIIGYYLGNIYMEIQDRPRFIVSETCGVRKKS